MAKWAINEDEFEMGKIERAEIYEQTARRLRQEAFEERNLPEQWEIGHRVKLLVDKEWVASAGTEMLIVKIDNPGKQIKNSTDQYQIFWTQHIGRPESGTFWTTTDEVEWIK
jgi:hypothetical protein